VHCAFEEEFSIINEEKKSGFAPKPRETLKVLEH
jgi:hypothetical protein